MVSSRSWVARSPSARETPAQSTTTGYFRCVRRGAGSFGMPKRPSVRGENELRQRPGDAPRFRERHVKEEAAGDRRR